MKSHTRDETINRYMNALAYCASLKSRTIPKVYESIVKKFGISASFRVTMIEAGFATQFTGRRGGMLLCDGFKELCENKIQLRNMAVRLIELNNKKVKSSIGKSKLKKQLTPVDEPQSNRKSVKLLLKDATISDIVAELKQRGYEGIITPTKQEISF